MRSVFHGAVAALPISILLAAPAAQANSNKNLFVAAEVDQSKFVIVAAPIGDGYRAQLNIYEQRSGSRSCFAIRAEGGAAVVDPLLAKFDFTGICNRFIDGNGYSLRVGAQDLGTLYSMSVVRKGNDNLLMAFPSRPGVGPEMVIARSGGHTQNSDYLLLQPEPGWKLMRRQFGGRNLGHVYLYRDGMPESAVAADQTTPSEAKTSVVKPAVVTPQPPAPPLAEASPTKTAAVKPELSTPTPQSVGEPVVVAPAAKAEPLF